MNGAIEVDGLRFSYPGASHPAVDGMSFHVERGVVFGFLGPNGAGKTTTQRILVGLLSGFTGAVRLLGAERSAWGRELYDRIGVSFELPVGYGRLTARENLEHFANLHALRPRGASELLEALDLADAADRLVSSFSKGMRVRLNLALALLHEPELLFLDEPTGGLDPVTARRVRELILSERGRGRTVFLTTHDMTTAELVCDRVAFVVAGAIAACDSPHRLKLAHGVKQVRVEYRENGNLRSESFPLDAPAPELKALLDSGRIETIHSQEASLEEVFLRVTGARL